MEKLKSYSSVSELVQVIARVNLAMAKQVEKSKCACALGIPELRVDVNFHTVSTATKAIKHKLRNDFPEYFRVTINSDIDLQKVLFVWAACFSYTRLELVGKPKELPTALITADDTTLIEFCEAMNEWYLESIGAKKRKK